MQQQFLCEYMHERVCGCVCVCVCVGWSRSIWGLPHSRHFIACAGQLLSVCVRLGLLKFQHWCQVSLPVACSDDASDLRVRLLCDRVCVCVCVFYFIAEKCNHKAFKGPSMRLPHHHPLFPTALQLYKAKICCIKAWGILSGAVATPQQSNGIFEYCEIAKWHGRMTGEIGPGAGPKQFEPPIDQLKTHKSSLKQIKGNSNNGNNNDKHSKWELKAEANQIYTFYGDWVPRPLPPPHSTRPRTDPSLIKL